MPSLVCLGILPPCPVQNVPYACGPVLGARQQDNAASGIMILWLEAYGIANGDTEKRG